MHIRLKSLQQLQGWRAARFQNGALALAPRTFVLKVCNSYKDGGRFLFKMGLSPEPSLSFTILKLEISNSYKDGRRLVFKMGPGRGGGRGGPIAVLAQASCWLGTLAAPPGQPSALTWGPVGPRRPCRPLQGSQTRWCCWPCASVPGPTLPPRRADASFQYKGQDGVQKGALYGTCTIAEDRLRITW